jgi:large subunit ribosomal protein L3
VGEALEGRVPNHPGSSEDARRHFEKAEGDEVRLIGFAQPALVPAIPAKVPSLFELRVSGDDPAARRKFALEQLGKELTVDQLTREGEFVDCIGITKGKGFQGHTKRWGVKLQPRKNSKHRRMIGTLGPHNPSFVTYRIPQAGQMGYHRRTAFNLRVLRVVKDPRKDPVTPLGGFLQYGEVRNACLLLHGSLPGPAKRLLRFRSPMRRHAGAVEKVEIRYLSTRSKQGA